MPAASATNAKASGAVALTVTVAAAAPRAADAPPPTRSGSGRPGSGRVPPLGVPRCVACSVCRLSPHLCVVPVFVTPSLLICWFPRLAWSHLGSRIPTTPAPHLGRTTPPCRRLLSQGVPRLAQLVLVGSWPYGFLVAPARPTGLASCQSSRLSGWSCSPPPSAITMPLSCAH